MAHVAGDIRTMRAHANELNKAAILDKKKGKELVAEATAMHLKASELEKQGQSLIRDADKAFTEAAAYNQSADVLERTLGKGAKGARLSAFEVKEGADQDNRGDVSKATLKVAYRLKDYLMAQPEHTASVAQLTAAGFHWGSIENVMETYYENYETWMSNKQGPNGGRPPRMVRYWTNEEVAERKKNAEGQKAKDEERTAEIALLASKPKSDDPVATSAAVRARLERAINDT